MNHHFEVQLKGKRKPIKFRSPNINPEEILNEEPLEEISKKEKERLKKMRRTILVQRMLPLNWDRL